MVMDMERKTISDALDIINEYEQASKQAKNTLEYHANVNPHVTLAKVKERLEKAK